MKTSILAAIATVLLLFSITFEIAAADATATMTLVNRTPLELQVRLADGTAVASIGPTASVRASLPVGRQRLLVFRSTGMLYMEASVVVRDDGGLIWEIPSEASTIEVHNNTVKDVTIRIDGKPVTQLAAGATTSISGVRGGQRLLSAVSGDITVASEHADIPERGTWYWVLGQPDSANAGIPLLRVANFTGEPAQILVNGEPRIEMKPGESAAMVGVPRGSVWLEARTVGGAVLERQQRTLQAGANPEWTVLGLSGGRAVLDVTNRTRSTLNVCVDGGECQRVQPERTVHFVSVVGGEHRFEARELTTGNTVEAFESDVKPGSTYHWVVETAEGAPASGPAS